MDKRQQRKIIQAIKKGFYSKPFSLTMFFIIFVGILVYANTMQNKRLEVDPKSYNPLLELVASVESKNNYDAYFANTRNKRINFTRMSIAEVLKWQSEHIAKGHASNAVGRYQIIDSTLSGLVAELKIDTKLLFDKPMQDRLAIALLKRRGGEKYINQELTQEQFAANIAMEWAALPKVIGENPEKSYYAADGLNKSLVSINQVMKAIEPISPK